VRRRRRRTSVFLPLSSTRLLRGPAPADTARRSAGPGADVSAEHTAAPSQRLHVLPDHRIPHRLSAPCLAFSLRWSRWTAPSLVFPVCSSHHRRALSEQTASWVPSPAPAGARLGLSLGTVTQNKDLGVS